jgi:hypothetical protein
MNELKPKEWHERLLADADRIEIEQHLKDGWDQGVTEIAVTLARQCHLFVHFERLWKMRVSDLDAKLSTEAYMKRIYVNKQDLYRKLRYTKPL